MVICPPFLCRTHRNSDGNRPFGNVLIANEENGANPRRVPEASRSWRKRSRTWRPSLSTCVRSLAGPLFLPANCLRRPSWDGRQTRTPKPRLERITRARFGNRRSLYKLWIPNSASTYPRIVFVEVVATIEVKCIPEKVHLLCD